MGVVDLALDERGQPVALKRLALNGSISEMSRARARVRREAEALSRLRHPNVVPLLGVVDEGDDLVLVMPYLAGGTLSDQVRAYGPLRAEQVLAIAAPLLDALATAHRAGVVHRDIKPANVLFDLDGRPFLSDFGIASFRDATSGLTVAGSIIGTPDFMAPEQARGESSTPETDVFALGATLLYAASGRRPYGTADGRVAMNRAAQGKVEPLPTDLDPRLARFLKPMLRANADKRPTAAGAAGIVARVLSMPRHPRRALRTTALALALVLSVGAAVLMGWRYGAENRVPATASPSTVAAPTTIATTTLPCNDLPYQPCGKPVAPHTDGSRCVEDHADYDADPANGCEASPDKIDGQRLERSITGANLVPEADTDRYTFHVDDNFSLSCDGQVIITLTAPSGTSMNLGVFDDQSELVESRAAEGGKPARVVIDEPGCGSDDAADFTAVVSYRGSARSAARYSLTKSGSF